MNNTFLSQMDTKSWCRVHFVGGYFDYIVDAVSLFAFMPTLRYETANDELDEKSEVKYLGLTRSQGKVLASLHNILPDFFGSMGDNPSIPVINIKTWDKWLSRD